MTRSNDSSRAARLPTIVPDAQPERDPISAGCHELLALFRGPLAEVRFPGVDRAVLDAAAEAVRVAQLEVESLELALDEARVRTRERHVELVALAAKALAYARVFAAGRDDLGVVLAEIGDFGASTPSPAGVGAPRKRGRPRKDSTTAPLLPAEASSELAE